ncbi:hypothetical protein RF55_2824 [Lasius niger]|uniref:Uncharacterized protein n=1 Tax=Lasius niger TaxID=67767 RepID=A0A0J7L2G4_LASNI|nr:hypothetical protein RF55_2824 [Lasius niger]
MRIPVRHNDASRIQTLEEDDEDDHDDDDDDEAVDDDEDHVDASSAATAPDVEYARRAEELSCARLCNHA